MSDFWASRKEPGFEQVKVGDLVRIHVGHRYDLVDKGISPEYATLTIRIDRADEHSIAGTVMNLPSSTRQP